MLVKITTKHASNSPVTFITHKRFVVLFFLPSWCVNSLLLYSSICYGCQLCVLIRYQTWEITCEWQITASHQTKHYIKRYKQQKCEVWKTIRQCNPFRSSSRFSIRASFCICCAIYTIFSCFEQLFLCFCQFGGSWHFLNFDKFRDAVPLSCLMTHFVLLPRAMMMTACDLNGTTKPWEIQKEVCQASSLPGSVK